MGFFSQRKKLSDQDEELYAIYADNDEYMGEISSYRTHDVQKINGVKCVIAMNGDTYEAIADEFGKFTSEILKANDVKTGAQPKAGDIVYISKKKKSGTGTYTAKEGETLYDISQKTGVRLRSLYRINGLVYGKQVSAGDVIRLKK
jgi:LysM repeat protein